MEDVGRVEHGVDGHEAAVAGAGDADAGGVGEAERDEVLDAGHLVGEFGVAEAVVDGGFQVVAAAHDAAVFALPHDVALVRVDLIDADAGPGIAHRRADAGAAIDRDDHGILLAGLEAGRLDQAAVEFAAVRTFEFDDLRGQDVVLVGLCAIGLAVDAEFLAIAGVERGAAGRGEVGVGIQIEGPGGAHRKRCA